MRMQKEWHGREARGHLYRDPLRRGSAIPTLASTPVVGSQQYTTSVDLFNFLAFIFSSPDFNINFPSFISIFPRSTNELRSDLLNLD